MRVVPFFAIQCRSDCVSLTVSRHYLSGSYCYFGENAYPGQVHCATGTALFARTSPQSPRTPRRWLGLPERGTHQQGNLLAAPAAFLFWFWRPVGFETALVSTRESWETHRKPRNQRQGAGGDWVLQSPGQGHGRENPGEFCKTLMEAGC